MGLFSGLYSFFNDGASLEDDERRNAEADARLRQLNRERAAALEEQGRIDEAEKYLAETEAHLREGYVGDIEAQVAESFYDGLDEGAANIRGAISTTAGGIVSSPFKLLPLWLIVLLLAGAALWFFGPPKFLRRA